VAPGLNSNSTTETATTITATGTAQALPSLCPYGLNHTYHIKHKVNLKQAAYQVLLIPQNPGSLGIPGPGWLSGISFSELYLLPYRVP